MGGCSVCGQCKRNSSPVGAKFTSGTTNVEAPLDTDNNSHNIMSQGSFFSRRGIGKVEVMYE